jgi:putative tricarboxylic transport membrane protein
MDVLNNLLNGFQTALSLKNIYLCFIGCVWGTMVGVLPGIGPLAGITLLIPATFGLDPTGAIIMLAGIYYGAMYGGSTTSILMNIPGESASVVTCLDGYQMTLKGRGGAALFISAWGSWIGGTLSIIGLMLLAPFLANFATKFGPPEMFSILLIAFILLGSLGSGSFFKTMPMVLLGLLVSTVGMDPLTGTLRFTHGVRKLFDGIGFIPVAMGALGIGEILKATEESLSRIIHKVRLRELLPTRQELGLLGPDLSRVRDWFSDWPPARLRPCFRVSSVTSPKSDSQRDPKNSEGAASKGPAPRLPTTPPPEVP